MKKIMVSVVAVLSVILMGCKSTSNVSSSKEITKTIPNNGVSVAGMETQIVDWDGRTVGAEAIPVWLASAKRGDYSLYISSFNKNESDAFRNSIGYGADIRSATMRADMAYARIIARELQQTINVYAAEQARSGNINDETRQAIEEVTKTQSDVEITGHHKASEFWQRVITTDPISGKKTSQYIVYQIYQISANTWAQTSSKYIKSVLGTIPENLTPEQDFVKGLVSEMMHDARFPTVMSQEEAKQSAEINKQIAEAQIGLMPAEQKAAADQALAEIMQDGITNRTKIVADSKVAQTQAVADASKMAYASGNPVFSSAATITGADKEWADAEALAASILF